MKKDNMWLLGLQVWVFEVLYLSHMIFFTYFAGINDREETS